VRESGITLPAAFLLFPIFFAAQPLPAASLLKVDRGLHDAFELLVLHCDSAAAFDLVYDRVSGEVEIAFKDGVVSTEAAAQLTGFKPGSALQSASVDAGSGYIRLKVAGTVFLREYYVGGPPALILDLSRLSDEAEQVGSLPFELNRSDYLKRGGEAERSGRLEEALAYVTRVQGSSPSDVGLTHRAGVIEQRLGRWADALETFGRSAGTTELAADAHARRTMIYFAMGDPAAATREWSHYFHRIRPEPVPTVEVAASRPEPANVNPSPLLRQTEATARTKRVLADFIPPRLLDLGPTGHLVLGWGLLLAGVGAILLLAFGQRRSPWDEVVEPEGPPTRRESSDHIPNSTYRTSSIPTTRQEQPPPVAASILANYVSSSGRTAPINPATRRDPPAATVHRIPSDRILELRREGVDEWDIARQLGIGRDEVSMVLNLARIRRTLSDDRRTLTEVPTTDN